MFSRFFSAKPTPLAGASQPIQGNSSAAPAPVVRREEKPTGNIPVKKFLVVISALGAVLFITLLSTPNKQAKKMSGSPAIQAQDTAAASGILASANRNYNALVSDLRHELPITNPSNPKQPGPTQAADPIIIPAAQSTGTRTLPIPGAPQTYDPASSAVSGRPGTGAAARPDSTKDAPKDALAELRTQLQVADERLEHESMASPLRVYTSRAVSPDHDRHDTTSQETSTALRDRAPAPQTAASAAPELAPAPQPAPTVQAASAQGPPTGPPAQSADRTALAQPRPQRDASRLIQESQNSASGPLHKLYEGTIIETVLTNRLNGSFTGPVDCLVTTTLWSHNREHVLVPQGSRVLGEARRTTQIGESRLAVIFHRIVMPDGYSVSLDKFTGLNQIGETGLKDKVDNHYVRIFGASIALGAIAGLATATTTYATTPTGPEMYRQGFSQQLSQEAVQILDRFLNVLPTITIREGARVKVYLTGDLLLPAYDNHRMPNDL